MAKNTLFNFLFQYQTKVRLPKGQKLELDTDKSNHCYYRISYPNSEKRSINDEGDEYLLDNHHLSIYENEHRNDPKLSQYHYTGVLKNKTGQSFRLHVHFNAFDEIINITFEQKIREFYQVVDIKNLRNQIMILALQHSEPLIKQLRQQHNEIIRTLEDRFNECDEQLAKLFEYRDEKPKELLEITAEACDVLREILPLVRIPHYAKLLRFYETIVRSLQERVSASRECIATTQTQGQDAPEAPEELTTRFSEDQAQQTDAPLKTKEHLAKPKKILSPLKLAVEELSSEFSALITAPMDGKAKKIEDVLAKTYELSLRFGDAFKLNELKKLQKLRREIQTMGTKLLPRLLFDNQFEQASQLTSFHYLLNSEKFLNVALQTRNIEMLDFILTYGDFDLDNQPVSVQKNKYPSAVHACFDENTPSAPMSECLSVLIKHGASLFAPDHKGLPLVYSILTEDLHPLQKAIFKNRDKTIDSPEFLKKLIALLGAYQAKTEVSPADISAIELELKNFEQQLEILQSIPLNDPGTRFLMKQANNLEEKYLGSFIRKLRSDPEIVDLNRRVQRAAMELNPKLSKMQQRQGRMVVTNYLKDLDQIFGKYDPLSLDFALIKIEVLKQLNNNLRLIEKKSDLLDVQHELMRNRRNKTYRKLARIEAQLLQDIKELEKDTPFFQDSKGMVESLQTLESLTGGSGGISNLLAQFSGIFSTTKISPTASKDEVVDDTPDFSSLSQDLEYLSLLLKKP